MSFLNKLFGKKTTTIEAPVWEHWYHDFYDESYIEEIKMKVPKSFEAYENNCSELLEELFILLKDDSEINPFDLEEKYLVIIDKLIQKNKLEKNATSFLIFEGNHHYGKEAEGVRLDTYSFSIYMYYKFNELYKKYNVSHHFNNLYFLCSDINDKIEFFYKELINNNYKYQKTYYRILEENVEFWRYSRSNYFEDFNGSIENNILMDENTFLSCLLSYEDMKANYKNALFYNVDYDHSQGYSAAHKNPKHLFFIKDPLKFKEVVTDCLDLYNFYYERLYSLDLELIVKSTSNIVNGNFIPEYYKFYATNTFNTPLWKEDMLYKVHRKIYSKAFFDLLKHISENNSYLLDNFKIAPLTCFKILESLNYYSKQNYYSYEEYCILKKIVEKIKR